tara:strand:+ start:260 stop:499 length:240 start_codon:yes stop_codon:yes gene_type:complete
MALRHGNKTYFQILLDPHRAELVQLLAKTQNKRATAWMRDIIYAHLKAEWPKQTYEDAAEKDALQWQRSIHRRADGKIK